MGDRAIPEERGVQRAVGTELGKSDVVEPDLVDAVHYGDAFMTVLQMEFAQAMVSGVAYTDDATGNCITDGVKLGLWRRSNTMEGGRTRISRVHPHKRNFNSLPSPRHAG